MFLIRSHFHLSFSVEMRTTKIPCRCLSKPWTQIHPIRVNKTQVFRNFLTWYPASFKIKTERLSLEVWKLLIVGRNASRRKGLVIYIRKGQWWHNTCRGRTSIRHQRKTSKSHTVHIEDSRGIHHNIIIFTVIWSHAKFTAVR